MKKFYYVLFRKSILKLLSNDIILAFNIMIHGFGGNNIKFEVSASDYWKLRTRIANKIENYDKVLNILFGINLEYKFNKEYIDCIEVIRNKKTLDFIKCKCSFMEDEE